MRIFLLATLAICASIAHAQVNDKYKSLIGKSIHCIVSDDRFSKEQHQSSLGNNASYSYIFKISLAKNGSYEIWNRQKEVTTRGKYQLKGDQLNLTSDIPHTTSYSITFYEKGKYVTLLTKDATFYCIVD